jgi:hypothetical protein
MQGLKPRVLGMYFGTTEVVPKYKASYIFANKISTKRSSLEFIWTGSDFLMSPRDCSMAIGQAVPRQANYLRFQRAPSLESSMIMPRAASWLRMASLRAKFLVRRAFSRSATRSSICWSVRE